MAFYELRTNNINGLNITLVFKAKTAAIATVLNYQSF